MDIDFTIKVTIDFSDHIAKLPGLAHVPERKGVSGQDRIRRAIKKINYVSIVKFFSFNSVTLDLETRDWVTARARSAEVSARILLVFERFHKYGLKSQREMSSLE